LSPSASSPESSLTRQFSGVDDDALLPAIVVRRLLLLLGRLELESSVVQADAGELRDALEFALVELVFRRMRRRDAALDPGDRRRERNSRCHLRGRGPPSESAGEPRAVFSSLLPPVQGHRERAGQLHLSDF